MQQEFIVGASEECECPAAADGEVLSDLSLYLQHCQQLLQRLRGLLLP